MIDFLNEAICALLWRKNVLIDERKKISVPARYGRRIHGE